MQGQSKLRERVFRATAEALADHKYVSPVDVFVGIGLLPGVHLQGWRIGRVEHLESVIQGNPSKRQEVMKILREWAEQQGLHANETPYLRTTRDGPVELRFSADGDSESERVYRTHYLSAALTPRKQAALKEKLSAEPRRVVFQIIKDSACSECGTELSKDSLLAMEGEQALCMACARLDHLEFLESGDAAMTRRATKFSGMVATVVRFSRSRGRYERQGILVEPAAIEKAEASCYADAEERAAHRLRDAQRRKEEDKQLVASMTEQIRKLFPRCPLTEAEEIARHTAARGSGRVGRSAAGRALKQDALILAVRAAVRHRHTPYDELLSKGVDRQDARERVLGTVEEVLQNWR